MRMFFALWPDAATRARIADAVSGLSWDAGARPVAAENYHVTLAFVGEIAPAQLPELRRIGQEQRALVCEVSFGGCEYWRSPRAIVAVADSAPPPLLDLSARLHRDLGLNAVERFRAHVTLARKVSQAPVRQALSPFCWRARSLSLVRSDRIGSRAVYTVVDTWSLLDKI